MKLGTKLTLYLSLVTILVLSGYGYLDILTRREILVKKMKAEVRSTGLTLKAALEKVTPAAEKAYVQGLIDTVSQYERNLSVIIYLTGDQLVFRAPMLKTKVDPFLALIRKAMGDGGPREEFATYEKQPIFVYAFSLQDREGKPIGGVAILQHISYMEKEIEAAKGSILLTTLLLIGGTMALVLWGARNWITRPISVLTQGIQNIARGDLGQPIELRGENELKDLARAFNQMAQDLQRARERILEEGERRLGLERSLRQSEKLATLGQLASGLAHEIGTPLNIIYGRAELIQANTEKREEIERNISIILRQTERITRIIQQLLGWARKKQPERAPLSLPALLENTLNLLEPQVRKQGVTVMKAWEENLPPGMGDPDQLQQVFLNLLLNAIQSMPRGGPLRLGVQSKMISKEGVEEIGGQYLEVRVEDAGVGMGKEALQSLFRPFFTTKDSGTGLGLMVTQGIVQDHGGWIEVESEPGIGSVFRVYLPSFTGDGKDA